MDKKLFAFQTDKIKLAVYAENPQQAKEKLRKIIDQLNKASNTEPEQIKQDFDNFVGIQVKF